MDLLAAGSYGLIMNSKQRDRIVEKIKRIRFLLLDVDGVMTDGRIYIDSEGRESKSFNIYDGHGIYLLQEAGIKVGIITGRRSKVVDIRAKELGIDEVHQMAIDKGRVYESILSKYKLRDEEVAYMGDDLIDIPVLKRTGLSISVANAVKEVKDISDIITDKEGGYGAVREITDLILNVQTQTNPSP
ncbi:MAG: KdsC family phosphatase [Nitrospirota bacterium]